MSLAEGLTNVFVGYGVAVVTQIIIFPRFGLQTTLAENIAMGAIFTVVSIVRSAEAPVRGDPDPQPARQRMRPLEPVIMSLPDSLS